MNTCAIRVGRLLELRPASGYRTVADVDLWFRSVAAEIDSKLIATRSFVVVSDWRFCPIMSSEGSQRLLNAIVAYNSRIERSAAIASGNSAGAVLQFLRLIRESRHPNRRLFDDIDELIAWMGDVLTIDEIARLRESLSEPIGRPLA